MNISRNPASDQSLSGQGVEITGVSVHRGDREILSIDTLTLGEPRIGVVGRNGSGKSTFARTLCGLIQPDDGRVTVNGVDMAGPRQEVIREVGILFQNPDHQIIFPTVLEELAFGLTQIGLSKDQAHQGGRDVLDRFGHAGWADRTIQTLSQGQRHLVCLMAVLIMEPRVIILDEPFAGLDIPTTRALLTYLSELGQQVLHISHVPGNLAGYDRILWIEKGRIVKDGPPSTVLPAFLSAMEAGHDLADLSD